MSLFLDKAITRKEHVPNIYWHSLNYSRKILFENITKETGTKDLIEWIEK